MLDAVIITIMSTPHILDMKIMPSPRHGTTSPSYHIRTNITGLFFQGCLGFNVRITECKKLFGCFKFFVGQASRKIVVTIIISAKKRQSSC